MTEGTNGTEFPAAEVIAEVAKQMPLIDTEKPFNAPGVLEEIFAHAKEVRTLQEAYDKAAERAKKAKKALETAQRIHNNLEREYEERYEAYCLRQQAKADAITIAETDPVGEGVAIQ